MQNPAPSSKLVCIRDATSNFLKQIQSLLHQTPWGWLFLSEIGGCPSLSVLLNAAERTAAWPCSRRRNRDTLKEVSQPPSVEVAPVCEDCHLLDTFLSRGIRWHYSAFIVKLKYPLNTFEGGFHCKYLGSLLPRRTCSRVFPSDVKPNTALFTHNSTN